MSEDKQQDMHPGKICWNEILTPDKGATLDFYTKLMGWTTQDKELPDGNRYTMFMQGDQMIAGCISPEGGNVPPMWLSYILVEDLDASTSRAKELGATIVMDRFDLPIGSFVIFADPQGAVIAFWQAGDADC